MTPLVELNFRLVQGDGWDYIFPCVYAVDGTPFPIAGYSADFSLRANYGDAAAIFAMTTSTPSANGSTIDIEIGPGSMILNAVHTIASPVDTQLLVALGAARQSKYYYTTRIISPSGVPTTVAAGTWYVWAKT